MSLSPTITYQIRPIQVSVLSYSLLTDAQGNIITDPQGTFITEDQVDTPTSAVTSAQVKTMLPVYDNQSATIISRLITSVQRRIEDYIDIDATLRTRMAWWSVPARRIELPYGTHGDILSVQRYNVHTNAWEDYTDYRVFGLDYKVLELGNNGHQIRVTFKSGSKLNEQLNQAILQEISYQFKNRNDPNMEPALTHAGLSIPTLNILTGIVR
jgi:hypothetical protein